MLVIRNAQMAAMAAAAWETWIRRHIREHFPAFSELLTADEIDLFVRAGTTAAQAYGFSAESDITQFIDLRILMGANFDTELPWAAAILASGSSHAVRMQQLVAESETRTFPR